MVTAFSGIDNMNDYYDVSLKQARLDMLNQNEDFKFEKVDILILDHLEKVFNLFKPDKVVNLYKSAGVRYSLKKSQCLYSNEYIGLCEYN